MKFINNRKSYKSWKTLFNRIEIKIEIIYINRISNIISINKIEIKYLNKSRNKKLKLRELNPIIFKKFQKMKLLSNRYLLTIFDKI